MKNRIVVWGTNGQNDRVLIALELNPEANRVNLYTIPEADATDEFTKKMMDEWRNGAPVELPEGTIKAERDLSVTEAILPDDLKVERSDVINRAQSEWHFVVLSHKMSQMYQSELAELRERVQAMTGYDKKMWDGLKSFWDKVSDQVRERNLFREHSDTLRDGINELFEQLKSLRTTADAGFKEISAKVLAEINDALDSVEAKIQSGGSRFSTVFDDLKALQSKYRSSKMTREDGDKAWNRLDAAFKQAKERRFGPNANEGSLVERHERRLTGLVDAIKKMQYSVDRDAEELRFQEKKVASSEGQLEAQIRTAKIRMVRERLVSKQEKLDEMKKTLAEVESQAAQARNRDAKRVEKEGERARFDQARQAAKERFDAEAKSHGPLAVKLAAPKTEETPESPAAEPIESPVAERVEAPKEESLFGAIGSMLGEALENLGDTVAAVATVVGEKLEEVVEAGTEKAAQMGEKLEDAVEAATEKAGEMRKKAGEAIESASEKAAEMGGQVGEKMEDVIESATEKAEEVVAELKEEKKKRAPKKAAAEAEPEADDAPKTDEEA